MCSSRKYPYLPHRRDFVQDPPPLSKFQLSFKHFFTFFVLRELPISPGISNPFCGGSMDIFWNHTIPYTALQLESDNMQIIRSPHLSMNQHLKGVDDSQVEA